MNSPYSDSTYSSDNSSCSSPLTFHQASNLLPPPPSPTLNGQNFPQQLDFSLLEVAARKAEMNIMLDDLEEFSI